MVENPTFPLGPLEQNCLLSTSESLLKRVPLPLSHTAEQKAGPGPDTSLANQCQQGLVGEQEGGVNPGKAATEGLPRGGRFFLERLRSPERILKSRVEKECFQLSRETAGAEA